MNAQTKKPTNCYEVELVMTYVVFVADAESEDKAIEFAQEELPMGAGDIVEVNVKLLEAEDVESSKRHADLRSEP